MNLFAWRKSQQKTLAEVATLLGIDDANPARTIQRFERGERRPSAVLIAKIEGVTGGSVTAQDMHQVRLQWELTSAGMAVAE